MPNVPETIRSKPYEDNFAMPQGYKIAIWETENKLRLANNETFKVAQDVLDSMIFFKELGLLRPDENLLFFPFYIGPNKNVFEIRFEYDSETLKPRFSDSPSIRKQPYQPYSNIPSALSLDYVNFDAFERLVKTRFKKHGFTPANGWKPFYYLDFVTRWQRDWTKQVFKKVDRMITAGIPLNKIWLLLKLECPEDDWESIIELPTSWLIHAYEKRVDHDS